MTIVGWGSAPWGGGAWGSPVSATLQMNSAIAVAENAVQITFNLPIYWSSLLDGTDASQPALWSFIPLVGGTAPIGRDGTPARPVSAASVEQVGTSGRSVIVTLDRPLTPSPATYYAVGSQQLQTADQTQSLNPAYSQQLFVGMFKKLVPPSTHPSSVATRDIAAPYGAQSVQAARVPFPQNLLQLGVPVVDDTGDYATDIGLVGLRKRVLRRLLFTPGATLCLGATFGAGALSYAKKLASAANRASLAAACEAQISQDPEVASVSVHTQFTPNSPGLYSLVVLVQSRNAGQGFKLLVPVEP
jgi:hypothetical protein